MSEDITGRAAGLARNAALILDEVARGGGGAAEVCAAHDRRITTAYENDDFAVNASNETSMYGVRVISGQRQGFSMTNSGEEARQRECAREAQQLARLSAPCEHHCIAAANAGALGHQLLCDDRLLAMEPAEVTAWCQRVVDAVRQDDRVVIDRIEFALDTSSRVLINSNGVEQASTQAACSFDITGMGKTAEEVTSFDYDGSCVSAHAAIASEIDACVSRFQESVLGSLGARRGETYRGRVLLHPMVVDELIGGMVRCNCDGMSHVDGTTQWKGRVGEQVAAATLNIYEDPLNRAFPAGWTPHDREGLRTQRHDLIRDGMLSFVAHSCFSAHKSGCDPTGNAHGSARETPYIDFASTVINGRGATASDEELVRLLGDGLVLKRFSGNCDFTSGHISGSAKNSYVVKGGARAHAVNQVMVSGDLHEVLTHIVEIGESQHPLWGAGSAPFILVDGISVTAA